jgi:NIPSNAP
MIYEYRVYEASPGRMGDLQSRFREHTLGIFARHGIRPVGFFVPDIGDSSDRLIYILAFESLAHREQCWGSFRADTEWQQVRRESEGDGPLVARVHASILTPTDFSALP